MAVPTFPQRHEPWFECGICGFDFPQSEGIKHYKKGFLVDTRCADLPTHSDYMEVLARRSENDVSSQQAVPQDTITIAPGPGPGGGGTGAGEGGAGEGGAGGV